MISQKFSPSVSLLAIDKGGKGETLTCTSFTERATTCPYGFETFNQFNVTDDGKSINIYQGPPKGAKKILTIRTESNNYCIGLKYVERNVIVEPLIFYCIPPCNGRKPCIR